MQRWTLDPYVVDVLMPDLVGHDRRPAAFLVYLFLLRQAAAAKRDTVSQLSATPANPVRRVLRPWR